MILSNTFTVRDLRAALEDLPDHLEVALILDHALAGHVEGPADCTTYDVELLAPVTSVVRGMSGLEVRVDWEAAG